ncbi:hypothetical protein GCM10028808_75230 [Spirosoma migulaei]
MIIQIEGHLLEQTLTPLKAATVQLEKALNREEKLRLEADRGKLMTEQQIQEYLQKHGETIRYYRTQGLPSFKVGADRWYSKGLIDDWPNEGRVNRHKK